MGREPAAVVVGVNDDGIFGLFATHPPVEKRIAALVQYGGGRVSDPGIIAW